MFKRQISLFYKILDRLFLGSGISRFYPVFWLNRAIINFLRQDCVSIDGRRMFLDPDDSLRLSVFGVYEPLETELIRKEVHGNDVIIDIGANIGYYTLIFASLSGEKGKVISFEPEPDSFALLKRNVELNCYKNVTLNKKAISDKNEKLKLYLNSNNKGDSRIYDPGNGSSFLEVEAVRLDDYLRDYTGRVDFIKMDVQGAENSALKGMAGTIKKNRHIKLFVEYWPAGLNSAGTSHEELLRLLLDHGFKIYDIGVQKNKLIVFNYEKLLRSYTVKKGNHTNLLCKRV